MAQVSLYLDKDTFGKVESAAHESGTSISKYVASILQGYFCNEWPAGYAELFGSVSDTTFFPEGAEKVMEDTARESLILP